MPIKRPTRKQGKQTKHKKIKTSLHVASLRNRRKPAMTHIWDTQVRLSVSGTESCDRSWAELGLAKPEPWSPSCNRCQIRVHLLHLPPVSIASNRTFGKNVTEYCQANVYCLYMNGITYISYNINQILAMPMLQKHKTDHRHNNTAQERMLRRHLQLGSPCSTCGPTKATWANRKWQKIKTPWSKKCASKHNGWNNFDRFTLTSILHPASEWRETVSAWGLHANSCHKG